VDFEFVLVTVEDKCSEEMELDSFLSTLNITPDEQTKTGVIVSPVLDDRIDCQTTVIRSSGVFSSGSLP
jgi:hypothetical protein